MTAPVELIPLKCIQCNTPIPADPGEVAWVCETCGRGQLITEEGLVSLKIHYGYGIPPDSEGFPFWVFEGHVTLDRAAYSGMEDDTSDSEQFWSQPRRFMIPAYEFPLDELTRKGPGWLRQPPDLQEGETVKFKPVTLTPEDVPALAEFIVMTLEAERMDNVRSIHMSLTQDHLELWILPRIDRL